jgi:hypothetical protein
MENLIRKFIEQNIKGVDTYKHGGSTWLIFTNDRKWVIELTKDKTLWYNFNFFKTIFDFFSMDVVENQHYITQWVEDTIINGVKHTNVDFSNSRQRVENTIQNGVKYTHMGCGDKTGWVDDTIENGVRHTYAEQNMIISFVENTIQNGELKTSSRNLEQFGQGYSLWKTETIINEGIRETELHKGIRPSAVEDTIENGVKETNHVDVMGFFNNKMEGALQNGVKETKTPGNGDIASTAEWMKENNSTSYPKMINDVIENGIKKVQPLPAQDGNRDWGNYYHGKEDRTKPFNEYLNEAIEFGVIAKTP